MTKLIHISLLKLSFTRMSLRRAANNNNNNNIIFNNISTRRERRRIVRDFLSPSMMLFSFSFLLSPRRRTRRRARRRLLPLVASLRGGVSNLFAGPRPRVERRVRAGRGRAGTPTVPAARASPDGLHARGVPAGASRIVLGQRWEDCLWWRWNYARCLCTLRYNLIPHLYFVR